MALVSVIIPAFNSAHHIRRSIDSALNQTVLPLEVIVVNDGSTDETEHIANSYGGIVRVISKGRNCGLPAARNFGIENALGDWIAFLDSDDAWEPKKNEFAINIVDALKIEWCMLAQESVHNSESKIDSGSFKCEAIHERYFSLALQNKGCCPSSMMLKKTVFEDVGGFNETLTTGEDLNMWWRIANKIPKIGYCEQPLVRYYVDVPGSMTSSPRDEIKLITFWESVTMIPDSVGDSENSALFMQMRDAFAAKAIRFYIRDGYCKVATYLKNNKNIHFNLAMKLMLMLPYPVSKTVFQLIHNVKNKHLPPFLKR